MRDWLDNPNLAALIFEAIAGELFSDHSGLWGELRTNPGRKYFLRNEISQATKQVLAVVRESRFAPSSVDVRLNAEAQTETPRLPR